jgi:tetratricopeptide (TPR) repeat protein
VGSRLLIGAVLGAALANSSAQAQPGPLPAAESAKQGTDLYTAGDFAGAVPHLQRAVEMEPNNIEYRFALAQALRQAGNCGEAVPHYKQVLASSPPERAEGVKTAMSACPNAGISEQPATPAPPPPPPEPVVVQSGMSGKNAALLVGAGLGLGAGAALFFAAHNDDNDANAAASFDDHDRISTRADRLRIASAISAGVGVVFGVIAVYRIKSSKEGTQLSFTPRKGGGSLVLERSW